MYYFRECLRMKRNFFIIGSLSFIVLLTGCGKALLEKGDEAFQQQKYTEALRFYLEVFKENQNDDTLKEKIAISYFREGEIFYEKRRVIKAFEMRVNIGLKYVSDYPSPNLKKILSNTYLRLAQAYKSQKGENPYQQREYFEKALENLEKSISMDSTNIAANEALAQFKNDYFQDLLEKGIVSYRKGSRDALQYIAADHYLTNALKLDPNNKQAKRYLKLTRKRALNLLDPGLDVPIAITDKMVNEDYIAFLVVVYNLLPDNLRVNASNFFLVREDGKEIRGKTTGMFSTPLDAETITNGQEAGGVVAFSLNDNQQFARLEFRKGDKVLGYKNLP